MWNESSTKRNIFRASLRRQYIQSYQRQIRQKYTQLEYQQSMLNQNSVMSTQHNCKDQLLLLQQILSLSCEQICKVDHFEFFIQCIEQVQEVKNISKKKYQRNSNGSMYQFQSNLQQTGWGWGNDRGQAEGDGFRVSKIGAGWVFKEKVYSLLYRILEKAFSEVNGKLWYIIERVIYLLQFPELMPLWEKISCIEDEKCKNYLSQQFSKKLSKSWSHESLNSQSLILDPDFILDILMNFLTQPPIITFNNCLLLLPFINYSLNIPSKIQKNSLDKIEIEESDYPKINKICIILRNVLKEDAKNRISLIFQSGFEALFLFLVSLIGRKDKSQEGRMSYSQLECGYVQTSKSWRASSSCSLIKRPANPQIITKTNLLKLLNRLLICNPEISSYILIQCDAKKILQQLVSQLKKTHCIEQSNQIQNASQSSQNLKYLSFILCDSHRIMQKTTLNTVSALLAAGQAIQRSFLLDFVNADGFQYLEHFSRVEGCVGGFTREISNILLMIQLESHLLYEKLSQQECSRYGKVLAYILNVWALAYLDKMNQVVPTTVSQLLQLRSCLLKLLKQCRNTLLGCYARATQPSLFQKCQKYFQTQACKQMLTQLIRRQNEIERSNEKNEQLQISEYSKQIVEICEDTKKYISKHG